MLLAMSYYQLRRLDEARATLASGLEIADKKLRKPESGDRGTYWADSIFAQVLVREARALIEGDGTKGSGGKNSDASALRKDQP